MTDIKTNRFDVAEYLVNETLINAYLDEPQFGISDSLSC